MCAQKKKVYGQKEMLLLERFEATTPGVEPGISRGGESQPKSSALAIRPRGRCLSACNLGIHSFCGEGEHWRTVHFRAELAITYRGSICLNTVLFTIDVYLAFVQSVFLVELQRRECQILHTLVHFLGCTYISVD
ncbi:hypothetical protein M441DRAFT_210628 [Trichoderma asperellum CBS 433.97]|uniref:Uncharacterized protein n=1 Tax=Trichoderma asperellum (strain ATCC 204424 / CBS 433.97 / NBRC 101777) TaxID=1042311 RepID=A0A2T3ZN14_TRIA4|nr:hypothetical protein M441DRAFT_210628 [Trichoderma asperellum CBS 433.97]PTB46192.1 hypothetical protein M441DRAFT_210628 [Trichoderma asperellum CBS 433.97]